jgi:hypothetical protein
MNKQALNFFKTAEQYVKTNFNDEMLKVDNRRFEDQNAEGFLRQCIYVVVNSGMPNQVAAKILERFYESGSNPNTIGHPNKRKAITQAPLNYKEWFEALQSSNDKIEYLESLPMMGPTIKYHLARNMGIDCAKPDRHLKRLAERFGYSEVQTMCEELAKESGYRIGTVDVILWRYCNMQPDY